MTNGPFFVGYTGKNDDGTETTWFVGYFSLNCCDQSTYTMVASLKHAFEFPDADTAMHFGHVMWNLNNKTFEPDERTMRVYSLADAEVSP